MSHELQILLAMWVASMVVAGGMRLLSYTVIGSIRNPNHGSRNRWTVARPESGPREVHNEVRS